MFRRVASGARMRVCTAPDGEKHAKRVTSFPAFGGRCLQRHVRNKIGSIVGGLHGLKMGFCRPLPMIDGMDGYLGGPA